MSLPQSYFIFSIGNITPIFQTTYKDCYKQYKTCPESLVNAETYVQVLQAARHRTLPSGSLFAPQTMVLQPACQKSSTLNQPSAQVGGMDGCVLTAFNPDLEKVVLTECLLWLRRSAASSWACS